MPAMVNSSPAATSTCRESPSTRVRDRRAVMGPDQVEAVPDAAPRRQTRAPSPSRRSPQTRHHERGAEELGAAKRRVDLFEAGSVVTVVGPRREEQREVGDVDARRPQVVQVFDDTVEIAAAELPGT